MFTTYERYSTGLRAHMGRGFVRPLLKILILFVVLYLVITSMFLTAFQVQSVSMQPLLLPRDKLLVSPLVYGSRILFFRARLPALREPRRGDVVVIQSPMYPRPSAVVAVLEPLVRVFTLQRGSLVRDAIGRRVPRYMVKRIVALPGDTVRLRDYQAFVRPAGAADFVPEGQLTEVSYEVVGTALPAGWRREFPFSGDLDALTLADGQYFVLGDNRPSSSDSRAWGPLERERIVARVLYRYWPFARGGRL
ncbi:MAG: signal peptidase I [Spirochaetales bacterium]|nr:signal peptidase I [Spirochaetales bacterium]